MHAADHRMPAEPEGTHPAAPDRKRPVEERPYDLRERTQAFALRTIRLTEALPKTPTARVIGHQLFRAGTSVGANYRAAARARSRADFIAKMGIVEEEADEASYWMELLEKAGIVTKERLEALIGEAHELAAICVASIRTARRRHK